jgi:hypothetical protein
LPRCDPGDSDGARRRPPKAHRARSREAHAQRLPQAHRAAEPRGPRETPIAGLASRVFAARRTSRASRPLPRTVRPRQTSEPVEAWRAWLDPRTLEACRDQRQRTNRQAGERAGQRAFRPVVVIARWLRASEQHQRPAAAVCSACRPGSSGRATHATPERAMRRQAALVARRQPSLPGGRNGRDRFGL